MPFADSRGGRRGSWSQPSRRSLPADARIPTLGGPGAPRAADSVDASGSLCPPSAPRPAPSPPSRKALSFLQPASPILAKSAYFNRILVTNTPPFLSVSHQALVTRSAFTLEKSKIATSEDTCLKEAMSFPCFFFLCSLYRYLLKASASEHAPEPHFGEVGVKLPRTPSLW